MRHRFDHDRGRLGLIAGVLLLAVAAAHAPRAVAQGGTLGVPITPAPAECTISPRPIDDLLRLGSVTGTPVPGEAEIAAPDPVTLLAGVPADDVTTSAVVDVIRHYVACLNAFDTQRSFALFTDQYLAQTLYDYGPLPGTTLSSSPTSIELSDEAWLTFAVASVSVLPDGRAAADVNVLPPASDDLPAGEISNIVYVLAQVDGTWRIDQSIVDDASRPNEVVAGRTFVGVIFNVGKAEGLVASLGEAGRYERFWHPARRHVFALETALPDYLESQTPELATRVSEEEYNRQYAGVVLDDRPFILVNAFCDATGTDWIDRALVVEDGGNCYFTVMYDVASGSFSDLRINGES